MWESTLSSPISTPSSSSSSTTTIKPSKHWIRFVWWLDWQIKISCCNFVPFGSVSRPMETKISFSPFFPYSSSSKTKSFFPWGRDEFDLNVLDRIFLHFFLSLLRNTFSQTHLFRLEQSLFFHLRLHQKVSPLCFQRQTKISGGRIIRWILLLLQQQSKRVMAAAPNWMIRVRMHPVWNTMTKEFESGTK